MLAGQLSHSHGITLCRTSQNNRAMKRPPHQKEFNMDQHPALARGRAAVITGAASGIGFGAARHFASLGMKVCLADLAGDALEQSAAAVSALADNPDHVIAVPTDVGDRAEVERLKDEVIATFGEVAFLMNNAGIEGGGGKLFGDPNRWRAILDTNLVGVINGTQVFAPVMAEQGTDCAIVNTGSKQGITTPPGNTAYNVSKAGVRIVTEAWRMNCGPCRSAASPRTCSSRASSIRD